MKRTRTVGAATERCVHRLGFTLVELLVVLGLIVILGAVGWAAWRRPVEPARDAALATLGALLAGARGQAALDGADAAVLVCVDPAAPERYLRQVVVAVERSGGWEPLDRGVTLPAGVYVLPEVALGTTAPGALRFPADSWTDLDGGDLRSTALKPWPAGAAPVLGSAAWLHVRIAPQGTTAGGVLWVASGRPEPAAVGATVRFENPAGVAGLSLSRYGAVTFLGSRLDR